MPYVVGLILYLSIFLYREEASELCQTMEASEGRERVVSEMADVLYHSMVLLSVQDVKMEEVMATLRKRFSQSGIEEKSKRPPKPTAD
jgi:phosphoribosyl-ATP pyrophosphohydrolase/phosphoribosyl-AMP cyclohydrolase